MTLGLRRRAYLLLRDTLNLLDQDFHSLDKFLILSQLLDLSETYARHKISSYSEILDDELKNSKITSKEYKKKFTSKI